jgi:hypothetical protein
MKRHSGIFTLIIAVIMLISALFTSACGNDPSEGGGTTAGAGEVQPPEDRSTEPAETEPQFSTAKYGGTDWVVYMRGQTETNYPSKYVIPSEDASDLISTEAVRRNQMTEDRFDIRIIAIEKSHPYKSVIKDIQGGEAVYDVVLDQRCYLGPLGLDGALVNLNTLDADYDTHWWDGKAADGYSVKGRLFVIPNDASVSNLGGVRFFYFNKEVLENFRLTSPYEYAARNEWVLDNFITMVRSVSAPNADGSLGVYGLVNEEGAVRNAMLVGCGIPWLTKIDEETIECQVGTAYADRTQVYFDKLKVMVADKNCCIDFDTAHSMDPEGASSFKNMFQHCRGLFAEGHFLFVHTNMNVAWQFTDMAKGFGVIMNPKLNSDQEEYCHMMDENCIIFGIPMFPGVDYQKAIDIMDYWGYVSSSTSMEAFYEITLKAKRASDPTAAEMLDTVKASINYTMAEVYANGTYSINVEDYVSAAYSGNVTRAWNSYKKMINSSINKVMTKIDALG